MYNVSISVSQITCVTMSKKMLEIIAFDHLPYAYLKYITMNFPNLINFNFI